MKTLRNLNYALENISVTDKGEVYNQKTGKKINQFIRKVKGIEYHSVSVYDKIKKQSRSFYVHRLVAFIYCEGYSKNTIIEHLDGNRLNNCASNLRWVTANQRRELRIETVDTVKEVTHLVNGMTIMPTEEWHKIKSYIKVLTDQIRYNNV